VKKTEHPLYSRWLKMRSRCNNPREDAYRWYGNRGINVCERWDDFWVFLDDMGEPPEEGLTIDRIDRDKDYSPENCRWATWHEQCENKVYGVTPEYDHTVIPKLERPLPKTGKRHITKRSETRYEVNLPEEGKRAFKYFATFKNLGDAEAAVRLSYWGG